MKRIIGVVLLVIALLPSTAHAMPYKFQNCPRARVANVEYLLYEDSAIVTKTTGKNVTIPPFIRVNGWKYKVDTIWDGSLTKNKELRVLDIRAHIEVCEDDTPFDYDWRRVRVVVHTQSDYEWLTNNGTSLVSLKK